MTFDTLKEYRRALGTFKKQKDTLFSQQEEDCARKDFNNYKIEYDHHGDIFTDKCLMTVKDIDAALVGKSETAKLKIIFHQLNIWLKVAGWRDVRTPFLRNNVKFGSAYLLENLKEIIVNHLQGGQRRDVRAMVPRPTQLSSAKPISSLGDELFDEMCNK